MFRNVTRTWRQTIVSQPLRTVKNSVAVQMKRKNITWILSLIVFFVTIPFGLIPQGRKDLQVG